MGCPRLCIVVGQLGRGGLEKQAYLIASGLSRRGFEVTVVSLSAGGAWAEPLRAAGVPLVELKRRGHFDLRRFANLVAVFRKMRPDLVYAFNYPTTVYARLAGLAASVPLLVTGERCVYLTRFQGLLERILARVTECVICNAEAIRRDLVERIGVPGRKVITVRNAIEPLAVGSVEARRSAQTLLGIPEGSFVVGTVGRVEDQKNLPMLVEVARLARDAGLDVRYCIIGDGSRMKAIQSMIHDLALDDHFVLAGERPAVRDLLPAFDVFVLTSGYEGLPNAVMEAMAAGLPCVCTDVGGCRELVEEGVTGFLVPPGDAPAMTRALQRLARDQRLRAVLGASGRNRILREFSLDRLLSQTEVVLRNLLAARDASPRGGRLPAGHTAGVE
jgi:glycosyltransferase involved in cell wall biosynthesis